MKFSITKLKAAFGTPKAIEKLDVETYTEDIINDIENDPFAISEQNVLYAGTNELGGYYYLQTVIVGAFKIKTIKGAQLTIMGNQSEIQLESDMEELESDVSNVSNRFITKIDFILNENDLPKLDKSLISSLTLTSKKDKVVFSKMEVSIDASEEEE
jgi:hypothetical protein